MFRYATYSTIQVIYLYNMNHIKNISMQFHVYKNTDIKINKTTHVHVHAL